MKTPTTDDRLTTSRFVARFGGRFLCRSPPNGGGGPPPEIDTETGMGERSGREPIHGRELASRRLVKKSRWRGTVRHVLALLFCLMVALMVLCDPLVATVLAAGFRLRRPRAEKPAVAMTATVVSERTTP